MGVWPSYGRDVDSLSFFQTIQARKDGTLDEQFCDILSGFLEVPETCPSGRSRDRWIVGLISFPMAGCLRKLITNALETPANCPDSTATGCSCDNVNYNEVCNVVGSPRRLEQMC